MIESLVRRLAGSLVVLLTVAGCTSDPEGPPDVTIEVGGQSTTIPAAMYCTEGSPQVLPDESSIAPLEVKPGQKILLTVPEAIAERGWNVQVWSATYNDGALVPDVQITTLDAGNAETYDQVTTSDAQPDRIYLIIALDPDKDSSSVDCKTAGGLWPIGLVRTPTESTPTSTSTSPTDPSPAVGSDSPASTTP